MERQFDLLYGYLALARRPGNGGDADKRTRLLVRELAAERSGCRWCIERVRHDWRAAGLAVDLLPQLVRHDSSPAFTEPERATAELIACMAEHHLFADEHR